MRLIVLGANGRTGCLVVREALADGHTVLAVVRSSSKMLDIEHTELSYAIGDCCDARFLSQVFEGQDAVISTLGGRSPTHKATSIYWRSAEAIVAAAYLSGLCKVAVTSSALLFPSRRLVDTILASLVRQVICSARRMEQTLCEADLDVVIARCGFLTSNSNRDYRYEFDTLPNEGSSMSRLSLARFLLDTVCEIRPGSHVYGVSDQKLLAAA